MLRRRLEIVLLLLLMAIISAIAIYEKPREGHEHYQYEQTQEVIHNPYIGFAPSADYVEAVGDNTLVYVEVTFKELEPSPGVFDFGAIEKKNYLWKWREEGKHVVFRLVCDVPGEVQHRDIPDWLYELTGDGKDYDMEYGKGYAPDYTNPVLIEEHAKAVKALGEYYGMDDFFYYIELGSLGHWGEWHVMLDANIPLIPEKNICELYIQPYLEAFPKAHFLLRRPFDIMEQELGVFNDLTGDINATNEWLDWIAQGGVYTEPMQPIALKPLPEIWDRQPVGGEFTSEKSMVDMLTSTELEQTISLLDASHMSFIGPKCPIACDEQAQYPQEVEEILRHVGYRLGVSEATIHYDWKKHTADVEMTLCNYGVAPMYEDWQVWLYLVDGRTGEVLERVPTDLLTSMIMTDQNCVSKVRMVSNILDKKDIDSGTISIAVGIENPQNEEDKLQLDMDVKHIGGVYFLSKSESNL